MKTRLLALLLLFLPLVASAQSFTPEVQSAYDDAMQPVNDAASKQIRQYEAQSRQAQQNVDQLLRDQQFQRLVDQHADYQRQQVEYQRQLLEQQRRQQQLIEEGLQQKSEPYYEQPSWNNNVVPQQSAQETARDSFAQGLADLELPNFAGDMPKLQQPSSLDILREAGVVDQNGAPRNSGQDFAARLIQIQQEKRLQDAIVIEALAKQGCIAFKMDVNNQFPVCSAWNSAAQNPSGVVGAIAAASSTAFVAPASSVPGSSQSSPAPYPAAAAAYAEGNSSISPFVWLIIGSSFLAIILFGLFMPKPKREIQAEADAK